MVYSVVLPEEEGPLDLGLVPGPVLAAQVPVLVPTDESLEREPQGEEGRGWSRLVCGLRIGSDGGDDVGRGRRLVAAEEEDLVRRR